MIWIWYEIALISGRSRSQARLYADSGDKLPMRVNSLFAIQVERASTRERNQPNK